MERFGTVAGGWLGTGAEPPVNGGSGWMREAEQSVWRPVILIVLLMTLVIVVRGHLPGGDDEPTPPRETPTGSVASLAVVATLLAVSLTVIAFAVISQLRNRSVAAAGTADRDAWRRGGGKRPTWRAVLIVLGLLVGYLVLVLVIARLFGQWGLDPQTPDAGTEPATPPAGDSSPPTPPPQNGPNVWPYLYAATVMFVLMVAVGTVAAARHRGRVVRPMAVSEPEPPAPAPAGGPESLVRAAEVGLAEIGDLNREPREAIIACYAAMEAQLARVPEAAPRQFDTASEVLARAVEHHALHGGSATRLVDLFGEARFSRHVMSEQDCDAAVQALQRVLDELRSPA